MDKKFASLLSGLAIVFCLQFGWLVFQVGNTFSDGAAYIGLPFPFAVIGGGFGFVPPSNTLVSVPLLIIDVLVSLLIACALALLIYRRSVKDSVQ